MLRRLLTVLLIASTLVLAGCESAKQRAEKHYEAGMALLKKGDVDRALVEFRNVFKLDGQNLKARLTYARLVRERGKVTEAYSQYLLVAEQYPDNLEARLALAEMAIDSNNWKEAQRHGRQAYKIAPDDPLAQVINATLDYQAAAVAKDRTAAADPAGKVQALLQANPDNRPLALIAYRVLIDRAITSPDPASAMPLLDKATALDPKNFAWQMLKLRLLAKAGDQQAVGADLNGLYTLFPQNQNVRNLLITWYMQQKDLAGAEAFLRRVADDTAKSGAPDATAAAQKARLNVVQFLQQTSGQKAAMAELDRLIAAEPDNIVYRAAKEGMIFASGQRAQAIAALQALLKNAPDNPDTRNVKVALARMLVTTGNNVGARALVEEVLASDPGHVTALKMKAAWLIEEDKPGDAIIALRTALDQDPKDPQILTLMGQAQERNGARDLAGQQYAAAVQVSGMAVPETLQYASFLIQDNRLDPALSVIENSLRVHPRDASLLTARANLLIRMQQWQNAANAVDQLRAVGTPPAIDTANKLQAALLLKQQKIDQTISFLDSLTKGADANIASVAAVVQTQVRDGKIDAARSYLDGLLAKTPDDPNLRFLRAGIYVLQDKPDAAEKIYRALIAEQPNDMRPMQALYKVLQVTGRGADAQKLLDETLAKHPDSAALLVMQATALEQAQDFEGAIAIYEKLYAKNSNNLVLANNLASMLTSYRSDTKSLERAFAIAARLNGTKVPAFQDTYGWIQYRRGNYKDALANLEPAAKGLATNALVQLHLGLTYAALKHERRGQDHADPGSETRRRQPAVRVRRGQEGARRSGQAPPRICTCFAGVPRRPLRPEPAFRDHREGCGQAATACG